MSNVQVKRHDSPKHGGKASTKKKSDTLFFLLAIAAIVMALIAVPMLLNMTGVSFLAAGSGLNKLVSVVVATLAGWLCVMPSQGYRDFVELAKGAKTEWRKTVKPDRDTVMKTTMMVLVLVFFFALLILLLDWVFGSVLRGFLG